MANPTQQNLKSTVPDWVIGGSDRVEPETLPASDRFTPTIYELIRVSHSRANIANDDGAPDDLCLLEAISDRPGAKTEPESRVCKKHKITPETIGAFTWEKQRCVRPDLGSIFATADAERKKRNEEWLTPIHVLLTLCQFSQTRSRRVIDCQAHSPLNIRITVMRMTDRGCFCDRTIGFLFDCAVQDPQLLTAKNTIAIGSIRRYAELLRHCEQFTDEGTATDLRTGWSAIIRFILREAQRRRVSSDSE
jgi:hypothetical protein